MDGWGERARGDAERPQGSGLSAATWIRVIAAVREPTVHCAFGS